MRGFMIICVILLVNIAQIYAGGVTLSGTIRDQGPDTMCANKPDNRWSCGEANGGVGFTNTDFEISRGYKDNVKGLCGNQCTMNNVGDCGVLGQDGTPTLVLRPLSTGSDQTQGNIYSYDSFRRWFHNDPQNRQISFPIPLSPIGGGNYQFQDDNFFPIDGQGWKDSALGGDKLFHNFGFCFEAHSRFGYRGNEIFTFNGDDDMWVFVNNRLAVDLGALHPSLEGSVNLSSVEAALGIQKGSNYRFDVFYCERHTVYSHCKITTNLELYCSYTDSCGICEGNGQSCCVKGSCDDNNPCTQDACDVHQAGACVHTLVNCPTPVDPCFQSSCATSGAQAGTCVSTAVSCDDGNACTVDTCSNVAGQASCVHTAKCNSHSLCVTDTCNNGNCGTVDTSAQCSQGDTNKCNQYSCDPISGCRKTTTNCDDKNPCTTDTCDPQTGQCSNTFACTTNGDKCLVASCKTSGCVVSPLVCPGDKCNISSCDSQNGCAQTPACPTGDACTISTCQLASGTCVSTPVNCDDQNACTVDSCTLPGGCVNTAIPCVPVDKCHTAKCDKYNGCIQTSLVCDDNNKCTDDSCNANTGCVYTPIDVPTKCDDNNKCTNDTCTPAVGCQSSPIPCVPQPCNTAQCTPTGGCVQTPLTVQCVNCPGGACTSSGKCMIASCDSTKGACVSTPKNCDDSNACTNDTCVNGDCVHTTIPCVQAANKCKIPSCDVTRGCITTDKKCDDGNPCTADVCVPSTGACNYTQIAAYCEVCGTTTCTSASSCFPNPCDQKSLTCTPKPVDCNDGNVCTTDKCDDSAAKAKCISTPIPLTPVDACHPLKCDAGAGNLAVDPCDDNDNCTTDSCTVVNNLPVCKHDPIQCPTADFCNPQSCYLGTCVAKPVTCNEATLCNSGTTRNDPDNSRCVCDYAPKNCSSFDTCNPTACNGTDGSCYVASVTTCTPSNACFTSAPSCDGTLGCVSSPTDFCNDNNLCTKDSCGGDNGVTAVGNDKAALCNNTPIVCPSPPDVCSTLAGCNSTTGNCTYIAKVCPMVLDFCLVALCDGIAGCINVSRVCSGTQDDNCFDSACSSDQKKCYDVRKSDFNTRQGKGGVLCPLLYDNTVKNAAIGAGAAAGIAVGGAAALGLAGFGGKKAFDHFAAGSGGAKSVTTNPLYESNLSAGDNPLYKA